MDLGRGCPGVIDPHRPCAPCTNKPENNSFYTFPSEVAALSGSVCTWQCDWGFFARPGDESECVPCSTFTAETCRPGFVLTPCNTVMNIDASCSLPCDGEVSGWIL